MDVTFTKATGRRYFMTVTRERGAKLEPRQGPGYHDHLPHDVIHFIVEAEARLAGGVFGRLARGENNIFVAADGRVQRRVSRREARRARHPADHEDMARSEALASVCQVVWELRAGQRTELPEWAPRDPGTVMPEGLLERIITRLDEFAEQWSALPVGAGVTLRWPLPATPRFPSAARTVGRGSAARRRTQAR